jgi:2-polyprenyl-6-hydroxyphenyl methylase/3-demethylubiquinone-9 3-methyltransferase
MSDNSATVDPAELDRFAREADAWWDPDGSFAALHRLNPTRLGFIRTELLAHFGANASRLQPFAGRSLLDIGCGGGLVAEPMARLGFRVTGIDAGSEAIAVAKAHAAAGGLAIDYRVGTAEALAAAGESFDVVLALEVVEHVADLDLFFESVGRLARPGGAFIAATLNRTARSFAMAILGGEYLLRWLPRGTHDWRKFRRPSEIVLGLARNGIVATRLVGIAYNPAAGSWSLSRNLDVNYMVMAVRR